MSIVSYDKVKAPDAPVSASREPKWPISYHSVGIIAIVCDFIAILATGIGCELLYNLIEFDSIGQPVLYFSFATVAAVIFVSILKTRDLYGPADLMDLRTQVRNATTVWTSVFLFLFGVLFTLKIGSDFSRIAIFSFGISGLALLILQRFVYRLVLIRGVAGERFAGRKAILITDTSPQDESSLLPSLLQHGFQLHRHFVFNAAEGHDEFVAEVVKYARGSDVDEIILNLDLTQWGEFSKLISGLRQLPLPINLIPAGALASIVNRPAHVMGNSVCVELQRGPLSGFERRIKRTIDIAGSVAGLILLTPLMVLSALAIKLDSPGPIFFHQRRCGFNGRRFEILKFRTMCVLEDGAEIAQARRLDQRVTRIGRWLRRTSIDELPQLLNVLNGTMSLVGPRPHALAHDNHFDKVVSNYAFRHHVKPGLTGWAQINGHRGPTPTVHEIRKRVECDLYYIDNWSLRLDLMIILRTFVEVMRARNAY